MGDIKESSSHKKDENAGFETPVLSRRNLMKQLGLGAGVAMAMLQVPLASAQQGQEATPHANPLAPASTEGFQHWPEIRESEQMVTSAQVGYTTFSGPGWVNNSGRAFGNGPMDEVSRRLVEFVSSYSESKLTDSFLGTFNSFMLASLADLYSGFESDPARINSRISQTMRGDMKCTVVGYGIVTTPEMAAFTNASMARHADLNDHRDELLWGVLAIGEALHATGPQVIAAIAIAYEVITALGDAGHGALGLRDAGGYDVMYHAPATALACGKLMGLNKDQLANALSLAMVPHIPLYVTHVGTLSMWKGSHSAEQVRNGVWGALLAQGGMTGPCQPFEGRDGLIAHVGPFSKELKFPESPDGRMAIETLYENGKGYKRFPAIGSSQTFLDDIAPPLVAWTKPEEVASLEFELPFNVWQEDGDPPKWDPENRETADHSLMYIICRTLIDKQIYIDSFTREKYTDPAVRELMQKITLHPNPTSNGEVLTVRKKSGEQRVFHGVGQSLLTHEDLLQRYNRAADFMRINKEQATRIREQWTNLRTCKDIAEAIQTMAKYGQPRPLADTTPTPFGNMPVGSGTA